MKKHFSFLVVLGVGVLMAAGSPALAQTAGPPDNGSGQIIAVGGNMGTLKEIALRHPHVESFVGLPGLPDPETGPVAIGSELVPSRGSAIVHPSGGTFVSPQQRADREIQRLIRKLG